MTPIPTARRLITADPGTAPAGEVMMAQKDRALRLRQLETLTGESFLVDLPQRSSLEGVFGFQLEDGRIIRIIPAPEHLLEVTGDLPRLLWQLGWMKQLCQSFPDRLVVKDLPGVEEALRDLGARVVRISGPFTPETPYQPRHPESHRHGPGCVHAPEVSETGEDPF